MPSSLSAPRTRRSSTTAVPAGRGTAFGAELRKDGVHFRVWAPRAASVRVMIEGAAEEVPLRREPGGVFAGLARGLKAGALYKYRLDDRGPFPDPCSRYQPQGPHGPSQVVDPRAYAWRDKGWRGISLKGQVIYELHVGAFTREGTFDAAARELKRLKDLGVTLVEVMPVAECPGAFNWGYDGVGLYAPSRNYGDPDAFKRFVDRAHALGLGVILDVVYNHLGPDGNYIREFTDTFFSRKNTDWGDAVNFDGPGSEGVRRFYVQNAAYWISAFHLDGLRLDATQDIHDASRTHVLADISRAARRAAEKRRIVLVAENEPQDARLVAPIEKGGRGLDAVWVDDFHHAARVALTGYREAYYTDYAGQARELAALVKRGFLYQGQRYEWQKKPRGTAVTGEPAEAFVFYLQNHDQIANSVDGARLTAITAPGRARAATALLLLSPQTPLLFMGQEYGAPNPFVFFADHESGLAAQVFKGRKAFLAQFPAYGAPEAQARVPDPRDPATFRACTLDPADRYPEGPWLRLHRDLLRLRREDPVIRAQDRRRLDAAALTDDALVLRFFGDGEDRLLLVNLGPALDFSPASEPLLAPPAGGEWKLLWSSNHPRYGGPGAVHPAPEGRWNLAAGSAVLLGAKSPR